MKQTLRWHRGLQNSGLVWWNPAGFHENVSGSVLPVNQKLAGCNFSPKKNWLDVIKKAKTKNKNNKIENFEG
jgi:Ni,Fe-hydrogenase III small subunit